LIRATPERIFSFHELPDAIGPVLPAWKNAGIINSSLTFIIHQ
jgi:hypothetical protein